MSIHKIGSDLIRPFGPKRSEAAERKADGESQDSKRAERVDQVGFSAEGLALAGLVQNVETDVSAERISNIEARIANGFYEEPEIAEEVARRVLDSGELDTFGS